MAARTQEIKFVLAVEDILRGVQDLENKLKSMRLSLIIDPKLPDGTPIDQLANHIRTAMGGAGSGGSPPQSPGSRNSGPQPGWSQALDDRSPWQRFRQDNPAYSMLQSQRNTYGYEQQIKMMTGGGTAESFISGRMKAAEASEDKATLEALRNFRRELVENSRELIKARNALASAPSGPGGDATRAEAATEIEERNRIRAAMVQTAGGMGGGGAAGPGGGAGGGMFGAAVGGIAAMAIGVGIKKALAFSQARLDEIARAPIHAQQTLGAAGDVNARLIGAGTSFTPESLMMMDPEITRGAASAGFRASQTAFLHPIRSTWSLMRGGNPMLEAGAKASEAYFDAAMRARGGELKDMSLVSGRMDMRRPIGQAFGMSQADMGGLSGNFLMPLTRESGFTEAQLQSAMQSGLGTGLGQGPGGMTGLRRSVTGLTGLARGTGADLDTLTGMAGGLRGVHGTDESAVQKLTIAMAKGTEMGIVGSPLIKLTEQLVQFAQAAGVGAGEMKTLMPFLEAGGRAAPGSPVLGGKIGTDMLGRLNQQMGQIGGMQGVLNWLTAQDTVNAFFPDGDSFAKERATNILAGRPAMEWDSEIVQRSLGKIPGLHKGVLASGGMTDAQRRQLVGIPTEPMSQFGAKRSMGYRKQILESVYGVEGEAAELSQFEPGMSGEAKALDVRARENFGGMSEEEFRKNRGLPPGTTIPGKTGADIIRERGDVNAQDPGVAAGAAADVGAAGRANEAIPGFARFVESYQKSALAVDGLSTAAEAAATNLWRVAGAASRITPVDPGQPTKPQ